MIYCLCVVLSVLIDRQVRCILRLNIYLFKYPNQIHYEG